MGDRGGAWGCALGFDGAFRALRDAGWGQSGGCRRLRHTCVAGVLGAARALWGSGPGTKLPSSLDTKAADDADVPDFGVCLVQFTQLLGGGTGVRASGILSGRAIGTDRRRRCCLITTPSRRRGTWPKVLQRLGAQAPAKSGHEGSGRAHAA